MLKLWVSVFVSSFEKCLENSQGDKWGKALFYVNFQTNRKRNIDRKDEGVSGIWKYETAKFIKTTF